MKKFVTPVLALLLAFSMILASFSPAQASASSSTTVWANPVAIPISGDLQFNTSVVEPTLLPGTLTTSAGLIVPAGFPEGENQFGGKALKLEGLSYGSAKICFPFPTHIAGWTGAIYQWLNNKWSKLATTITPGQESTPAMACATVTADGTFALLVGLTNPPQIGPCADTTIRGFGLRIVEEDSSLQIMYIMFKPEIADGVQVSYEILNIQPAGALHGSLVGRGETTSFSDLSFAMIDSRYKIYYDYSLGPVTFTVRLKLPGCYVDSNVNWLGGI